MKNIYRAWVQNESGASAGVSNDDNFTSIKSAEQAARAEFASGWKVKIDRLELDGSGDYILGTTRVKEFTIR